VQVFAPNGRMTKVDHPAIGVDNLAIGIAQRLLAGWLLRLEGYEHRGCQIIIHLEPGQTQARIEWPPPLEHIKTK
jgi:hypothetical protein